MPIRLLLPCVDQHDFLPYLKHVHGNILCQQHCPWCLPSCMIPFCLCQQGYGHLPPQQAKFELPYKRTAGFSMALMVPYHWRLKMEENTRISGTAWFEMMLSCKSFTKIKRITFLLKKLFWVFCLRFCPWFLSFPFSCTFHLTSPVESIKTTILKQPVRQSSHTSKPSASTLIVLSKNAGVPFHNPRFIAPSHAWLLPTWAAAADRALRPVPSQSERVGRSRQGFGRLPR